MKELKDRRTPTSKIFYKNKVGESQHQFQFQGSAVPIHYNNKLAIGDGIRGFREIDITLESLGNAGWINYYNSFQPFMPKYADQWMIFRDLYGNKDRQLKFKPVCNHVEGILLPNLDGITSGNCILYTDAFGEGLDLIYYFDTNSLKKVIRIRDGYANTSGMSFDFEIDFNNEKIYRGYLSNTVVYELDQSSSKEFDTDKVTFIGSDGDFSILEPYKAWDNNENSEIVLTSYIRAGNKKSLRKSLSSSFLTTAFGDIYTDVSFIPNSTGMGWIRRTGVAVTSFTVGAWTSLRAAATGSTTDIIGAVNVATDYSTPGGTPTIRLERAFFPIDTTSIPSGSSIDSGSFDFNISGGDNYNSYSSTNFPNGQDIVLIETTQASLSALGAGDFSNIILDSPTEGAARVNAGSPLVTGSYSFTLNSNGLSFVQPNGITKLGMRLSHDVDNIFPQNPLGEDPSINGGATVIKRGVILMESGRVGQDGGTSPTLNVTFTAAARSRGNIQINIS